MQPGKFFFVVGPSGSGKDSLISGVMPLLPNNQFLVARRVITRQALLHTEDHDSCSPAEFLEREISGDFIITWQAHGLHYGLPSSLLNAIEQGVHVIANGSRSMVHLLQEKVPHLCVIEVNAPIEVLRMRLSSRERETPEEIEKRLTRASLPLPAGISSFKINNNLSLGIGISRLKAILLCNLESTDKLQQDLYQKICGKSLNRASYSQLIPAIIQKKFSFDDVQTFLIACTEHLTEDEIVSIAHARTFNYPRVAWGKSIVVDKHSLGGIIGNRVSLVVIPIIAAFGLLIPKTSSRAITSASGTADTMEVLAKVDLNFDEVKACVQATNGCVTWNGKLNHSLLDDAINPITKSYGLDSRKWSVASILSKKYTAGSTHIVIDVPYSSSAKVKTQQEAVELAHLFEHVGKEIGLIVKAFPTDGDLPIGMGIGPALEARDVLQVLANDPKASIPLLEKSLFFAAHILAFDPSISNFDAGYQLAKKLLESGAALKKMEAIINFQGKIPAQDLKIYTLEVTAESNGRVQKIDGGIISDIARHCGAPVLKLAGVDLKKLPGDEVVQGEPLYLIQSTDLEKLQDAHQKALRNSGFVMASLTT